MKADVSSELWVVDISVGSVVPVPGDVSSSVVGVRVVSSDVVGFEESSVGDDDESSVVGVEFSVAGVEESSSVAVVESSGVDVESTVVGVEESLLVVDTEKFSVVGAEISSVDVISVIGVTCSSSLLVKKYGWIANTWKLAEGTRPRQNSIGASGV